MPTARPFARNTGAAIAGTTQVGNLAVGIPTAGFAATGLPWWNGPDEEPGYVIATQVAANNQPTPVSTSYTIGQSAEGGFIAYILQPGDPGYDANVQKGLVAAPSDIYNTFGENWFWKWWNGSYVFIGATGTALGTGLSNSNLIVSSQGAPTTPFVYAARECRNLTTGGYTDWYLPSKDELNKLYINRDLIAMPNINSYYWTSSEVSAVYAWWQLWTNGQQGNDFNTKENGIYVRAVRSFTAAPTTASVGFWRSTALTDASFIEIAEYVSRIAGTTQTFASASAANTWLIANGYWTSYPVIVTSGLVMHVDAANPISWPGSGNSWIDISGAGYNMDVELNQGTTYLAVGNASNPTFSSANGGSFECEPSAAMGSANSIPNFFSSGNGYSIEMWVRLTSFRGAVSSAGSTLLLLTQPNFTSVNSNGTILLVGNVASGNLTFNLYQGFLELRGSVSVLSNSDLNNWVQVVLTVDNVANGQIITYRNGAQASTSTLSTQMSLANTRPLISCYNPVVGINGSYGRYGIIRLYNKRLSALEVSQNFQTNKSRFGL